MLKYINQNEYKELLGVDSIPDDFNKLVIEASTYINYRTFNRIDINNIPEEVKYVTCLIIQETNKTNEKINEVGNLKSQNIEGWSESYSTPEELKQDLENKKESILREHLWNVIGIDGQPLLYSGVC